MNLRVFMWTIYLFEKCMHAIEVYSAITPSEVVSKLLLELETNWVINEHGQLYKDYKFNNFMGAMSFVNISSRNCRKRNV